MPLLQRSRRLAACPPTRRMAHRSTCLDSQLPLPPVLSRRKANLFCPQCESKNLVWCPRRTGYAICAGCEHAWLADARHLWPEVWRLVAECRPRQVFGEQVDSVSALDWLAALQASLEILGYGTRAEGLPASCVGAFHIRGRFFWMAESSSEGYGRGCRRLLNEEKTERIGGNRTALTSLKLVAELAGWPSPTKGNADGSRRGCERDGPQAGRQQSNCFPERCRETGGMAEPEIPESRGGAVESRGFRGRNRGTC